MLALRSYGAFICAVLVCLCASTDLRAQAEKRIALVIGNGDYATAPLKNPVNDAQDIAATLRDMGFDVIYRENVNRRQMRMSVREFSRQIRRGGVGLFYFAGHGVQVDGSNYLIPVGAGIEEEFEVADEGLDVDSVLRAMEDADNRLNIIILDACRNNPFARSFRSATRGLARVSAPTGSLVAYSTAPGDVAADGDGRNGIYTKHLLAAMREAGSTLEQVFKQVRIRVESETAGRQVPWEESSLTGDFYFVPGGPGPTAAAGTATMSANTVREQLIWQGIAASDNPADFEQFLRDFPDGNFSAFARNRLAALEEEGRPSGAAAGPAAVPARRQSAGSTIRLTGHGELVKSHGAMTADQHYQFVADALKGYFARRNMQLGDEGILAGGPAAVETRLGTLDGPGAALLYLTVVGATRPFGSGKDLVRLDCYTPDGGLQWSVEESNFFARSREESLTKAVSKLEKKLEPQFGSACLPIGN